MSTLGASWKKKRDEEARARDARDAALRALSLIAVETTADKTVNTAETEILTKTVIVGGSRYVCLRFWGECNVAGALTLTVNAYVDGVLAASSRQYCTAAGYWHFDWNPYVDVAQGERVITVKMVTSASSLTIATGQAQLIIETRGVAGKVPEMDKEVNLNLTLMDMPSAPVVGTAVGSTGDAATIDKSITVMDMSSDPQPSLFVVYERNQTLDDSYLDIYGDTWEAQTFTVGVEHCCDQLGAKVYRVGDPSTCFFALYDTSSGLPKDELASGSFTGGDLTEALAGQWQYASITGQTLSTDVKYALVASAPSPVAGQVAWQAMGAVAGTAVNADRTYGWAFTLSVDRNVTHLSLYAYYSATYTLRLWRASDSSQLGTVTGACTAGEWTHLVLASPVAITAAGGTYVVSMDHDYSEGNTFYRRANPAATEFTPEITFVQGRYAAGLGNYPATANSTYANGVCGFKTDAPGLLRWRNDASSPTYANGARVGTTTASSSWTEDTTRDFIFEEGDQR